MLLEAIPGDIRQEPVLLPAGLTTLYMDGQFGCPLMAGDMHAHIALSLATARRNWRPGRRPGHTTNLEDTRAVPRQAGIRPLYDDILSRGNGGSLLFPCPGGRPSIHNSLSSTFLAAFGCTPSGLQPLAAAQRFMTATQGRGRVVRSPVRAAYPAATEEKYNSAQSFCWTS